jgi:hypothetical protein
MTNDSKADKKSQRAADARLAWADYEAEQAAINKNMERLRAERLAREAKKSVEPGPLKQKKK